MTDDEQTLATIVAMPRDLETNIDMGMRGAREQKDSEDAYRQAARLGRSVGGPCIGGAAYM